jgi:hypothetical protein
MPVKSLLTDEGKLQRILLPYRVWLIIIFAAYSFGFIPSANLCLAVEPSVETFYWPPGMFLTYGKLKQAQKEIMLSEVENKLASLRQMGKVLLVRGNLMDKVRTDVPELNPATILDQCGFIVIVNNFPNIYFNFNGPQALINRNTFLVIKNPKVDRTESFIRQSMVLRGDFYAFTQAYLKSTVENLQKAIKAQAAPGKIEELQPEKGKKR